MIFKTNKNSIIKRKKDKKKKKEISEEIIFPKRIPPI